MPGFDKTGPQGKGPKTGRGLGLCGKKQVTKTKLGFGMGQGLRKGRRFLKEQVVTSKKKK